MRASERLRPPATAKKRRNAGLLTGTLPAEHASSKRRGCLPLFTPYGEPPPTSRALGLWHRKYFCECAAGAAATAGLLLVTLFPAPVPPTDR